MKKYKYDVVLSFAGEDREYAEELANKLKQRNLDVFYDKWYQASLWGPNLALRLGDIYSKKSKYAVIIVSKKYIEKNWTKHELKYIQERVFEDDGYGLPLFLEEVEVPGFPKTYGRIYASEYTLDEIADMIFEKVIHSKRGEDSEEFLSDLKTMEITDENGRIEVVDVLLTFEITDLKKEYVIYTKHEYDDDENVTLYASQLYRSTEGPVLLGIETEEEWSRIRGVLRAVSEDGDVNIQDCLSPAKFDKDGIEIL